MCVQVEAASVVGAIRFYLNPLGSMTQALKALVREPYESILLVVIILVVEFIILLLSISCAPFLQVGMFRADELCRLSPGDGTAVFPLSHRS